jgi:myo-inositol-1(or 4)-monophosphatase
VTPDDLLELFEKAAIAVRGALAPLSGPERRTRTERPGQYAIDVVADAAALDVLGHAPIAIVSEESGRTGRPDAAITVVLDPIDGSSNAVRDLPYWAISLCALDADGPLAALVANQATGTSTTAVRGSGAWRDGRRLQSADVKRVEDAVVALSSLPGRMLHWKQFRALGSAALALCDVAAGALDGYVDGGNWHAPWDYLGGLLACQEAGAVVVDVRGLPLAVTDPDSRRQLIASCTPELLETLLTAVEA